MNLSEHISLSRVEIAHMHTHTLAVCRLKAPSDEVDLSKLMSPEVNRSKS